MHFLARFGRGIAERIFAHFRASTGAEGEILLRRLFIYITCAAEQPHMNTYNRYCNEPNS